MEAFMTNLLERGGLPALVIGVLGLVFYRAAKEGWSVFRAFLADIVGSIKELSSKLEAQADRTADHHAATAEAIGELTKEVAVLRAVNGDREEWDDERTPIGSPSRRSTRRR